MKRRSNRGDVLIIATLGIFLIALLLLLFQKIVISQLIKNEAMSYAEKAAYIKFLKGKNIASGKVFKENYGEFAGKKISLTVKDNFWGVRSKVRVKIPYKNKTIVESFHITAPGRIIK